MAAIQKPITAEEFARLPDPLDGSQQELVRGIIITTPAAGRGHGVCCSRIAMRIGAFVAENNLGTPTCNGTGFMVRRDPDTVRGPDISFWSGAKLSELPAGYLDVAPDLAVEVVSPGDHYARVQRKVNDYLEHGVRLTWVVILRTEVLPCSTGGTSRNLCVRRTSWRASTCCLALAAAWPTCCQNLDR